MVDYPADNPRTNPTNPTHHHSHHSHLWLVSALCFYIFLPCDGMQSAVMRQYVVCMSVCPSVMFTYHDHIGWHTFKIISRLNSIRYLLRLTLTSAIWSNGNTSKIRVEWGWGHEHKNLQYLGNGAR